MDLKVDINPEDVNKAISEAVLHSALGKVLKEAVEKKVKEIDNGYWKTNPLDRVLDQEILTVVREYLQGEYMPMIKKLIKEKMTEAFVSDVFGKMWDTFISRY